MSSESFANPELDHHRAGNPAVPHMCLRWCLRLHLISCIACVRHINTHARLHLARWRCTAREHAAFFRCSRSRPTDGGVRLPECIVWFMPASRRAAWVNAEILAEIPAAPRSLLNRRLGVVRVCLFWWIRHYYLFSLWLIFVRFENNEYWHSRAVPTMNLSFTYCYRHARTQQAQL